MAKKNVDDPAVNAFHKALNLQEAKVGRFLSTAEVMRVFSRMRPQLRKAILKGVAKKPPRPKRVVKPKLAVVK